MDAPKLQVGHWLVTVTQIYCGEMAGQISSNLFEHFSW